MHDTVMDSDCDGRYSETRVGIKEKWCLRCFLKTGRVEAEETWGGSLFQTPDAVDEKDLEVAIDDFLNGADMDIEEEDRSQWRI